MENTCPRCGTNLAYGAKFCMECGAPIVQEKICSQCGAELPPEAKFCVFCGATQKMLGCSVVAKDKEHLMSLIDESIAKDGLECDLNFIDVGHIEDMSGIFAWEEDSQRHDFNGDISKWNVSNVKDMSAMFYSSAFNGDISNWNVSNVTNMSEMFGQAKFNGDISRWNVSSVTTMREMFNESWFNGDISKWNVSNVTNMRCMFLNSQSDFCYGFDGWNVSKVKTMRAMFRGCIFSDCAMICASLNRWKVPSSTDVEGMFVDSTLEQKGIFPKWCSDKPVKEPELNWSDVKLEWFDPTLSGSEDANTKNASFVDDHLDEEDED
ncbi:BspA family leucine-rich repeat surface protein [Fibrobacter sp.]|uniref:BspA family leucine-rich repeat surface protein n=1 Tax=Fibrobacter sp. TaxID=35828 RepID=UPI003890C977